LANFEVFSLQVDQIDPSILYLLSFEGISHQTIFADLVKNPQYFIFFSRNHEYCPSSLAAIIRLTQSDMKTLWRLPLWSDWSHH